MKRFEKFSDSFLLWGTPVMMSLFFTFFEYGFPPQIRVEHVPSFYLGGLLGFIVGFIVDMFMKSRGLTIRAIVNKMLDNG